MSATSGWVKKKREENLLLCNLKNEKFSSITCKMQIAQYLVLETSGTLLIHAC
jgi:hypothetical protein